MRAKDFSKGLALLMIYLMISLTISSAAVFGMIYESQAYGQADKIPGVTRQTDTVIFNAIASYPLSITGYFSNNAPVAMNCKGTEPNLNCSYSVPVSGIVGVVGGTMAEMSPGTDSATAAAYPDFFPPSINNVVVTSIGSAVRASFSIVDPSSPSYPDQCSGFKKVELLINNRVVNNMSYPIGVCSVNDEMTGSIDNYVGQVNTSIRVTDYVGLITTFNSGTKVSISTKKPVIKPTVKVYSPGTNTEVRAVATESNVVRPVDVSVEIESADIPSTGGVFGDFTSFDKTGSVDQSNAGASCDVSETAGSFTCRFSSIRLSPAELQPSFQVRATDSIGNYANATLRASFSQHTGASITTAKVYKPGTTDAITVISTNASARERTVDIAVIVTDSVTVFSANGNFEEINRNLGVGQGDVNTDCYQNESAEGATTNTYICLFQGLRFNPATTNPKINISVSDELGKQTSKQISLSFITVNSAGTVTRLGPEPTHCISQMCYVKLTGNNITADINTQSTYLDSNININGVPATCTKESRWVCQAYLSFGLNDRTITLQGTDDLGNFITYINSNITVDPAAPVIKNITAITSDRRGLDDLKKGDVVLVNITVNDTTQIKATADLNGLKEETFDENGNPIAPTDQLTPGTCTRARAGIYQCTWSVSIGTEGYKVVEVPIIIEDAAGQQAPPTQLTFTVKETTEVETNMWAMSSKQSPTRVNKRLLMYYGKRIYSHLKFTSPIPDGRIASATLKQCMPIQAEQPEQTGSNLPTLTPEIVTMNEDKTDILAYVQIPEGSYNTNTLKWSCNISLISTTSTQFFKTPEIENYNITVIVDESKLMSDKVDDEVKDIQDYLNGKGPATIRNIDKFVTKLTGMCGVISTFEKGASMFSALESVLSIFGIGLGSKAAATAGTAAHGGAAKVAKGIGKVCDVLTCDAKWQHTITDLVTEVPGMNEIAKAGQLAGMDPQGLTSFGTKEEKDNATRNLFRSVFNPEENLASAIIMLCPTGVIHNLKKNQVFQCEKLRCLQEDVPAGLPPGECEKNFRYTKCQYLWGNILDAVPWAKFGSYIANNMMQIIADPLAMGTAIITGLLCPKIPVAHGICLLPQTIASINKITSTLSAVKDIANKFSSMWSNNKYGATSSQDVCDIVMQKSEYLSIPYDVRTGVMLPGACISGVGCPVDNVVQPSPGNNKIITVKGSADGLKTWLKISPIKAEEKKTEQEVKANPTSQETKDKLKELQDTLDSIKNKQTEFANKRQEYYEKNVPEAWRQDPTLMKMMFVSSQFEGVTCNSQGCDIPPEMVIVVEGLLYSGQNIGDNLDAILKDNTLALDEDAKTKIKAIIASTEGMESSFEGLKVALDDSRLSGIFLNCVIGPQKCHITGADAEKLQKFMANYTSAVQDKAAAMWWDRPGENNAFFQAWRSAAAYGRAVHQLSMVMIPNGVWKGYSDTVNRALGETWLGYVFNTQAKLERDFCTSRLEEGSVGASTVMNFDQSGYRHTAAHIEGEAEEIVNYSSSPPVYTGNYIYVISGGITNGIPDNDALDDDNHPLEFDIVLDNTFIIQNRTSVNASQKYSLGSGSPLRFTEPHLYSKVCIRFYSNPHNFFDEVFVENSNPWELCNEIILYTSS